MRYLKINRFCSLKENVKRLKSQTEEIFANQIYDEVCVSKIYKKLKIQQKIKTNKNR